jgi:hypothetical protein
MGNGIFGNYRDAHGNLNYSLGIYEFLIQNYFMNCGPDGIYGIFN